MLVYVPTDADPLLGKWMELPQAPKAKPCVVRAIWQARLEIKLRYGYPEADCQEWAAQDVAKMLGVEVSMVRRFCRIDRAITK